MLLHRWLYWIFLYVFWCTYARVSPEYLSRNSVDGHTVYESSNLTSHAELFSKVVIPVFILFLYDYWPSMFHFCQDDYSCLVLIFLVMVSLLFIIPFPGIKKRMYLDTNPLSVVCVVSQFLACKIRTSLHQVSPSFLLVRILSWVTKWERTSKESLKSWPHALPFPAFFPLQVSNEDITWDKDGNFDSYMGLHIQRVELRAPLVT